MLYRRWLGWPLALVGGILYIFLPDNLRVALGEGNLPRALASALLPYLGYFLFSCLEQDSKYWHAYGLGFMVSLVVLSHAMMGAIYSIGCVAIISLLWITRGVSRQRLLRSLGLICLGLLTTGFWLLPSLTGGITELDPSSVAEAITSVPLADYLNPVTRSVNPEAIYVGAALITTSLIGTLYAIKSRRSNIRAFVLMLIGLGSVAITLPGILQLFNALPIHNLLWPVRFLGMASFCMLLGILWLLSDTLKHQWIVIIALVLIALDGSGSLWLVHLRPEKPDLMAVRSNISTRPGWREATLDFSRIGSEAAYLLATQSHREQIFGWAYQGAYTAQTVAMLNEALEYRRLEYLLDRLNLFGVDDVVLLNELESAGLLKQRLIQAGFSPVYHGGMVDLSGW